MTGNIPGIATVINGRGNLPMVRVSAPQAAGEMYLHGGHVTSWKPTGADEVLFVSGKARYEDGHAIRGGVPVCFPWFGPLAGHPDAPSHGCVRTKTWQLEAVAIVNGAAVVTMSTRSGDDTRRFSSADFLLQHRVTFGTALTMELIVTNTGDSPLRFEEALHTYYRVGHIDGVRLHGLDGTRYLDSVNAKREERQHGDITFTGETDRIYLDTHAPVDVHDAASGRRLHIAAGNARSTVVWNPWVRRAQAFADMGDDEWRDFVCVETCNVAPSAVVTIGPDEQHTMRAQVTVHRGGPARA